MNPTQSAATNPPSNSPDQGGVDLGFGDHTLPQIPVSQGRTSEGEASKAVPSNLALDPSQHRFFSLFSREDAERLLAASTERSLVAGEVLFRAGSPSDGLFLVLSGTIEVRNQVRADRAVVLKLVKAGDYFGELGVIDGKPRFSEGAALKDAKVLFVPGELCSDLLWSNVSETGEHPLLTDIFKRIRLTFRRYADRSAKSESAVAFGKETEKFFLSLLKTLLKIQSAAEAIARDKGLPVAVEREAHSIVTATEKATTRSADFLAACRDFAEQLGSESGPTSSARELVQHDVPDEESPHPTVGVPRESLRQKPWHMESLSDQEQTRLIAEHPIFKILKSEQRHLLLDSAQKFQLPKDEILFAQGEPADSFFLVIDGELRFSRHSTNGVAAITGSSSGDVFLGELSAIDGRPRTKTVVATTDATLVRIPRENVAQLIAQDPFNVGRAVMGHIFEKARTSSQMYLAQLLRREKLAMMARSSREVVHDIRCPIAVLQMAAEMVAQSSNSPENYKAPLSVIAPNIDRIRKMIGDLSDDQEEESVTPFASLTVAQVMNDFKEQVSELLRKNDVELSVSAGEELIIGEEDELIRMLENLLINSIDAFEGKGGTISLSSEIVDKGDKQFARITFADNGKGIPESVRSRIFEPYATFGKESGTGLGLWIVKSIVTRHGGEISCRSEEGKGTKFVIQLPV